MEWNINNSWDFSDTLINVKKDTQDSGVEDIATQKHKINAEKTYQIIHELEELGLPKNGEQVKIITFKSFNAILFLKHITEKETVEDLKLVIYSFNYDASKLLDTLINEGKIKKATILMSNLRNKAHREKEQLTRDMLVANPKIDLFFASSHAKIMAMRTNKGNNYVIEGSGNLSFNSRIEQYCLTNDSKLFDFTSNWMEEVKVFLKGRKELILT